MKDCDLQTNSEFMIKLPVDSSVTKLRKYPN